MSRSSQLAKHIERTMTGPMWHGPGLLQVLDGVSHDDAAARPIPAAHSIWEMVLHVAAWAEIARARLRGERIGDPPAAEDWPPVGSPTLDGWQHALERLGASHRLLADDVGALTDAALDAKVASLEYSASVLLHGIVEHGTYHGVQIILLRKAGAPPRQP